VFGLLDDLIKQCSGLLLTSWRRKTTSSRTDFLS